MRFPSFGVGDLEHIHDSTITTTGQKWTNGSNSSFDLKLGFTRNPELMAF
jgi:hypothetical protein